jgi:hypothetical protein
MTIALSCLSSHVDSLRFIRVTPTLLHCRSHPCWPVLVSVYEEMRGDWWETISLTRLTSSKLLQVTSFNMTLGIISKTKRDCWANHSHGSPPILGHNTILTGCDDTVQGYAAKSKVLCVAENKNANYLRACLCNKSQIHQPRVGEGSRASQPRYSFVVASGATRLLINLMIHSGNALTATITATFHPNRTETTNDRSKKQEKVRTAMITETKADTSRDGTHRSIRVRRPC